MIYSLGYATKKGVKIFDREGKARIIPSIKIGNMFWPNPSEMGEFIEGLKGDDILLSPSGPNESYLAGAFRKGVEVRWINPARIVDEFGKGRRIGPNNLLDIWTQKPEIFYPYLADNFQIAQLSVVYANWLKVEREKVALENSLSQTLAREMESFRFLAPPKKEWVEEKVQNQVLRFRASAQRGGVKLPKEVVEQYKGHIRKEMEVHYDVCLAGNTKEIEKVQKKLRELEMVNILGLLVEQERRVESLLRSLPHNSFFEDLKGVGPKSKSGVLVFIGNPLRYPNFPRLNSYSGMRVVEGQAIRKSDPVNKEDLRYDHQARRVLCFDFGDKAHYHQGFFQDLYYAYKLHQYLIYWPLIDLSQEVFQYWDEKEVNQTLLNQWLKKLEQMIPELPLLERNKQRQLMIADLRKNPNWTDFRRLFSRGKNCTNLQMTPLRIEYQAKRLNGITLARIVYYRWLEFLERPLPLAEDFVYQQQCKSVKADGELYDYQVHLQYYRKRVKELQQKGKTLPEEVWQKFPSELRIK